MYYTGGLDYSGVSQLLTFPAGVDELCTSFISILGDDLIEPTEGFRISLTAINSDINVGGEVVASILDDDRMLYFPGLIILCMTLVSSSGPFPASQC